MDEDLRSHAAGEAPGRVALAGHLAAVLLRPARRTIGSIRCRVARRRILRGIRRRIGTRPVAVRARIGRRVRRRIAAARSPTASGEEEEERKGALHVLSSSIVTRLRGEGNVRHSRISTAVGVR